jgi:hypothetical protein
MQRSTTDLQLVEPGVHASVAEQADEVQSAVLEGLLDVLETFALVYLPGTQRQIDQFRAACCHRLTIGNSFTNNTSDFLPCLILLRFGFEMAYMILPPFLFICRWIVQFCTIERQIKRNGGSTRLRASPRDS